MTGQRRLSQAVSEGDGISLIVPVEDLDAARAAEQAGAEGLLVSTDVPGVHDATGLPVLRRSGTGEADACVLTVDDLGDDGALERRYAGLLDIGMECVVEVTDAEQLEAVLERVDPEIFLLSPGNERGGDAATERVLDLLPDVPAGKLAIADLGVTSIEEVAELERTGFDAVIVGTRDVAGLAGAAPPEV